MKIEDLNIEKELKVIFMGTPEFSVPILEELIKNYKVRAVVTQPDRPIGRKGEISFSPIKRVAIQNTILVLQPNKLKEEYQQIIELEPDIIITCAYGQILPKELLNAPKYGCINVHASLLPKLRGGAPIHRALMNGYTKTGITIMYMNVAMDEGDIITQEELEISDTDTASSLHEKLREMGKNLLIKTLPSILEGTAPRIKQDNSQATYGFTVQREDERIDFGNTKRQIYNKIRGLYDWPGAYCLFEGKILKVWKAYITENYFSEAYNGQITAIYKDGFGIKVSNGEIVFTEVQQEGKARMNAVAFINGLSNKNGILNKILD